MEIGVITGLRSNGNCFERVTRFGLGVCQLSCSDGRLATREIAERTAAEAARPIAHVFRVYTREMLLNGTVDMQVGRRVMNGFYPPRGPDMYVLLEPYWLYGAKGTTHSTTFSYDAHVPVIFMGPGIRAGRYNQEIGVEDIAPTLATYLAIETPSGSMGRCLAEILE